MVEKQSYRPPFHHKLLSHLRPLVPKLLSHLRPLVPPHGDVLILTHED